MLEFLDVLGRNDVRTGAEQLPELDERGAEFLQRKPKPLRAAAAFGDPLDPHRGNLLSQLNEHTGSQRIGHFLEAVLHQHGHDVPVSPQPI